MRRQIHIHTVQSRACPRFLPAVCGMAILAAILSPGICQAQTETPPEEKKPGVMIRMLCVQSLTGEEEQATLATKTEDGKWIEHDTTTLRSPFITSWFRVPRGTTHLIRKNGQKIISVGSFLISQDSERSIILLFPDKTKNTYRTQVIDPGKLGFNKGKILIINYGKIPAMVKMGKISITVNPGQQVVERIDANKDEMNRLLVAYVDKDRKIVPCYDHSVSSNPQTRKFILLFPDQKTGLRAMNLSEFGPFE